MTSTLLLLSPVWCLLLPGVAFFPAGLLVSSRRSWGHAAAGVLLLATLAWFNLPGASESTTALQHDGFGRSLQGLVLVSGFLLVLTSLGRSGQSPHQPEYYGSVLVGLGSAALVMTVSDALMLFIGWEMLSVATTGRLYFSSAGAVSREAAVKHALQGLLASAVLWLGLMLLCGLSGSLSMTAPGVQAAGVEAARSAPAAMSESLREALAVAGLLLVLAGLGWRGAVAPFHAHWADLLQGGNSADAGLLLIVGRIVGMGIAMRVVLAWAPLLGSRGVWVILLAAGVTWIVGAVTACVEQRIRLLFGSLFVASAGLPLLVLALELWARLHPAVPGRAGWPQGPSNMWLLLAAQSFAILGMFSSLHYLGRPGRAVTFVEDLRGLVHREPWPAGVIGLSVLSLIGLPPLAGFWGMWFAVLETMSVRVIVAESRIPDVHPLFVGIVVLGVVCSFLTAGACFQLLATMLLDHPLARPRPSGGRPALVAGLLSAAAIIGIGVFPGRAVQWWHRQAASVSSSAAGAAVPGLNPADRSGTIQHVRVAPIFSQNMIGRDVDPAW